MNLLILLFLVIVTPQVTMQDTVVLYSSITPDIVLSQLGDTQTINICNQTQESLFNALAGLDFLFLIDFS